MTLGNPRVFHKKFKFLVEIDGITVAAFQKCSELSVEVAKIEQSEGGALTPNKSPGRATFTDITLERGATDDPDLYNWMLEVVDAVNNVGLEEPEFKKDLDIVQLNRAGNEKVRWRVKGAWPVKHVAGEWDNEADENVIEMVTLTYDSYQRIAVAA